MFDPKLEQSLVMPTGTHYALVVQQEAHVGDVARMATSGARVEAESGGQGKVRCTKDAKRSTNSSQLSPMQAFSDTGVQRSRCREDKQGERGNLVTTYL